MEEPTNEAGADDRLGPAPPPQWAQSAPLTVEEVVALFDERTGSTVGLEEELMLLDRETLELSAAGPQVLEDVRDDERYAAELREGQIEIRTPVCGNAVAAGLCLADAILDLRDRLGSEVVVASAGTHPFSSAWGRITEGDRYREIAEEFPAAGRGICRAACTYTSRCAGAERALAVFNAARSYLPELTALAANSPFVGGRTPAWPRAAASSLRSPSQRSRRPRSRPGRRTSSSSSGVGKEGHSGTPATSGGDLRPHPVFGTIELRASDSQTRLEDAAAMAALFQCLLVWLSGRFDDGDELAVHESSRITENLWRARRYGTRGVVADLVTGEQVEMRARISRAARRPRAHGGALRDDVGAAHGAGAAR